MNTASIFGNDDAPPCVDCGQHPLRAHHDRNGAAFTHYYVPPVEHEQAAPEGEEWRIRNNGYGRPETILDGNREIATVNYRKYAAQIIRDRHLAALVPGLVAAIEAEAARRAYAAGLGVSEWRAFLWPEAVTVMNAVAKEREQ